MAYVCVFGLVGLGIEPSPCDCLGGNYWNDVEGMSLLVPCFGKLCGLVALGKFFAGLWVVVVTEVIESKSYSAG